MDFFEQILALTEDRAVRMALALAAVVLLILVVASVYRRIAQRGPLTKRGRVARLAILEAIPVDQRRRLILLRRDNTEHLVLIGGPTDVVVEEGIHRQARQPTNKRPVPERAVPERPSVDRPATDPADVPRIPISAKNSEPAAAPKPIHSPPETARTNTPPPAPVIPSTSNSPAVPVALPAAVIPAAAIAASTLPEANGTPPISSGPVIATPPEPVETAPSEDPQIAEMERKLQDALKVPVSDTPESLTEDEATEDPDVPDIESSLEAAIADAVASDAVDTTSETASDGETGNLTERLDNINSGKSAPG